MKIAAIAFKHAIKIGTSEENVLIASRDLREVYDIQLVDSVRVRVACLRTQDVTMTSLFNVKWWKEAECKPSAKSEPEPQEKTSSSKKPASKKL